MLVTQLCSSTLCDPVDYRLSVSSVQGILQARGLEWAVIPFSRGSFQPGSNLGFLHCGKTLYHLNHQEVEGEYLKAICESIKLLLLTQTR